MCITFSVVLGLFAAFNSLPSELTIHLEGSRLDIKANEEIFTSASRYRVDLKESIPSESENAQQNRPSQFDSSSRLPYTYGYSLKSSSDQLLAKVSPRCFDWGTSGNLIDPSGQRIGFIEEETSATGHRAEYRLFNSEGKPVAIASTNWIGTTCEIVDFQDRSIVLAVITNPFFGFLYPISMRIENKKAFEEKIVDPHLLLMLFTYVADRGNRESRRRPADALIMNFWERWGVEHERVDDSRDRLQNQRSVAP